MTMMETLGGQVCFWGIAIMLAVVLIIVLGAGWVSADAERQSERTEGKKG